MSGKTENPLLLTPIPVLFFVPPAPALMWELESPGIPLIKECCGARHLFAMGKGSAAEHACATSVTSWLCQCPPPPHAEMETQDKLLQAAGHSTSVQQEGTVSRSVQACSQLAQLWWGVQPNTASTEDGIGELWLQNCSCTHTNRAGVSIAFCTPQFPLEFYADYSTDSIFTHLSRDDEPRCQPQSLPLPPHSSSAFRGKFSFSAVASSSLLLSQLYPKCPEMSHLLHPPNSHSHPYWWESVFALRNKKLELTSHWDESSSSHLPQPRVKSRAGKGQFIFWRVIF